MQDVSDLKELLKGVAVRDEMSCTRLLSVYGRFVHQVVRGVLHNHQDSEEVAQDVMLRVIDQAHKFNFQNKFSTWLYRIAMNAAISFTRTASYRMRLRSSDIEDYALEDEHQHNDLQERWDILLKDLEPDERALLVMHYSQQMPLADVAQVLSSTEGAIKVRLHRLRNRIQNEIAVEGNL